MHLFKALFLAFAIVCDVAIACDNGTVQGCVARGLDANTMNSAVGE
jgi:hypothetical protein